MVTDTGLTMPETWELQGITHVAGNGGGGSARNCKIPGEKAVLYGQAPSNDAENAPNRWQKVANTSNRVAFRRETTAK